MRAISQEISVAPGVLQWARETIGKGISDVAKRLDISNGLVEKWESGDKSPTLLQLRELAIFYKRPLAVFFLPSPPQEAPLPADFRTLPTTTKKPFSEKTLLALRRARRLQSLAGDLNRSIDRMSPQLIGQAALSDDPLKLATQVRAQLKVSTEVQFLWKNEAEAFNAWKHCIEEQGALVFELPFPLEEGRAFSFAETDNPAIVINSNDPITARIFSLFHEYGHLLLGSSGICDFSEKEEAMERFCNRFAGELLVPPLSLLEHPVVQNQKHKINWDEGELQRIAGQFKVSSEVILRRLLINGRTTENFYKEKRREWALRLRDEQKKRRGGRRIPARQCIRQNGIPFTSLVLESARLEKITYRDVSDYLSVGLKHLTAVESLVREGKARYG